MEVNTYIKPSKIHGLGLFAAKDIKPGQRIIQASKIDLNNYQNEWIEYIGKNKKPSLNMVKGFCLINHCEDPNCKRNKGFYPIAKKLIKQNEEITEDYNSLPDIENPFKKTPSRMLFEAAYASDYQV